MNKLSFYSFIIAGFTLKSALGFAIALVWLINGLVCKIFNLVPRHQLIVARILGNQYSFVLTKTIGVLEVIMFVWIVSGIQSSNCAIIQIVLVAGMNIIEFMKAPDLLLFGRVNILVAILFIAAVYYNEFILSNFTNQ